MALIVIIAGGVLAGLAVGLIAEYVIRRWSRQIDAHMALDALVDRDPTYLVDPDTRDSCWMCRPHEFDTYDGRSCWRCRIRIDAYTATPAELWPTKGDR